MVARLQTKPHFQLTPIEVFFNGKTPMVTLNAATKRQFSEPSIAALERILTKLSPVLQASFLSSVKALGITGAIEALEQAFGIQDINTLIHSLSWQSMQLRLLKSVQAVAHRALSAGASEMGAPALLRLGIRLRFDLQNPRAVAWAENRSAQLVVQVTEDTRQALRTIINRAFVDHIPPRDAARLIKNTIGLHEQWANAVYSYEQRLLASGKSAAQIAKLVERYRERLLKARALNIARTEIATASNRGQWELWQQAAENGLLDRNKVRRIWILGPNPCPLCKDVAANNDVGATLDGNFSSADGETFAEMPPLHPSCVCTTALEFI